MIHIIKMSMNHKILQWGFLALVLSLSACKPTQQTHTPDSAQNKDGNMRTPVSQATTVSSDNLFQHPSENAASFVLSKNGTPLYDILIPIQASSAEQQSAKVLQLNLGKICKCQAKFPIINRRGSRPYISIGQTNEVRQLKRQSSSLGEEGYEILIQAKNLFFIADGPIGIVNASLAFLEEDLGVRWWSKQLYEAYFPLTPSIKVSLAPRMSKPAFEYREPYFNETQSKSYFSHNRTRVSRSVAEYPLYDWQPFKQYPPGYEQHTFRDFIPGQEFAVNHPEYYSERNGKRIVPNKYNYGTQLCLSNHTVASIVARRAKGILDKSPTATKIHISQNDGGGGFCDCHNCTKINQREGGRSGSLIYFINRVADELKQSHPKVEVVTFAYKETAVAPKNIRPRDNVIVELCTDHHWGTPLIPIEEDKNFVSLINGWNKLGTKVYIWDYAVDFSNYLKPWPNIEVIARNIKFYQQKGVKGVLLQGPYQGNNQGSDRALLKAWVWGKLLWDPNLDPKALTHDFNRAMFSDGGYEAANQYSELLDASWRQYQKDGYSIVNIDSESLDQESLGLVSKARALTKDPTQLKYIAYWEASVLYNIISRGPKEVNDIPEYNRNLDRFQSLCQEYDIKRLREQMLQKGNIERFVEDSKVNAENVRLKSTSSSIRFHEKGYFRPPVWSEEITPKVTKDELAENKYAMSLNTNIPGWRMNLYIPREYNGQTEYQLNIALRVDWRKKLTPKAGAQQAFRLFAYDEKTKGVLVSRVLLLNELRDKEYITFEVGPFSPKNNDRIVIAPYEKEFVDNYYIDYIELVPIKK